MQEETLITWSAKLYEPKHKSVDWFWILGTITFIAIALLFYFQNYVFAAVIFIASITIGIYANEHLDEETISITKKGIQIDSDFYNFEEIKSFWVFTEDMEHNKRLLLTLKRNFFVHVNLPLGDTEPDELKLVLRKYILERKQAPSLADSLMEWLSF